MSPRIGEARLKWEANRRWDTMRTVLVSMLLSVACALTSLPQSEGSGFMRKYCDKLHTFEPAADPNFLEMLDNLLANSKSSSSRAVVTAKDSDGHFEGKAGCVWHNCQIYDGECYACASTRDSAMCIETVIDEIKNGFQSSDRRMETGCQRTREFSSGERSVAVDKASTTFQICGLQYQYLGDRVMIRRDYQTAHSQF